MWAMCESVQLEKGRELYGTCAREKFGKSDRERREVLESKV